jgi:hypothetical protein
MMTLPAEQTLTEPADADLLARTVTGDGEALGLLYERYAGMLTRVATRLLGSRSDAADWRHVPPSGQSVRLPGALRLGRWG